MRNAVKPAGVGRVVGARDRAFELGQLVAFRRHRHAGVRVLLEFGKLFLRRPRSAMARRGRAAVAATAGLACDSLWLVSDRGDSVLGRGESCLLGARMSRRADATAQAASGQQLAPRRAFAGLLTIC